MKMIYSDYLERMIPQRFTRQLVYFSNDGSEKMLFGKVKTYEWNEDDLVYYNVDRDDDYYMEIPANGTKGFSLKLGRKCRVLVKVI